ncbi:MAG: Crp/Fnr family transcriptional regulator [Pseudomonadota bacterium]|nr:Crp/Fnr family transcriptional regulator [Pseudomonadota bacterium]
MATLTNCRIARFPHDRLRGLVSDHDHLGRLLWLSTIVDASIHREWMLSLGRRPANSRLAHLMCELKVRLETAELTEGLSYELPLTQTELAEILGLTPVHINRTLKELRETGVVTIRNRMVEIADWDGLVALAEFDPFYPSLQQRPR